MLVKKKLNLKISNKSSSGDIVVVEIGTEIEKELQSEDDCGNLAEDVLRQTLIDMQAAEKEIPIIAKLKLSLNTHEDGKSVEFQSFEEFE
jgi:hypothetical protein